MTQSEIIPILDFGSQYAQLIARRVREKGVYSELVRPDISIDDLRKEIQALSIDGKVQLSGPDFAAATPKLLGAEPEFRRILNEGLQFTKPSFNEEMRAGLTNM